MWTHKQPQHSHDSTALPSIHGPPFYPSPRTVHMIPQAPNNLPHRSIGSASLLHSRSPPSTGTHHRGAVILLFTAARSLLLSPLRGFPASLERIPPNLGRSSRNNTMRRCLLLTCLALLLSALPQLAHSEKEWNLGDVCAVDIDLTRGSSNMIAASQLPSAID